MLRIILIIGNALCILAIFWLCIDDPPPISAYGILTPLVILFILNIYFILGGRYDLYSKRKKLEEEIKIQEAENKLRELKEKK